MCLLIDCYLPKLMGNTLVRSLFSDRLVYIILHQYKKFFLNFVISQKNTDHRILIFAPIDSETHVSYLCIIHFDTLIPLFFELSSKIKKIPRFLLESRKLLIFEDNSKIKEVGIKMYYGQVRNMGFDWCKN